MFEYLGPSLWNYLGRGVAVLKGDLSLGFKGPGPHHF